MNEKTYIVYDQDCDQYHDFDNKESAIDYMKEEILNDIESYEDRFIFYDCVKYVPVIDVNVNICLSL